MGAGFRARARFVLLGEGVVWFLMELGKKLIAGNWKMYKTIAEAIAFVDGLLPKIASFKNPLFLAVPYTALWPLHEKCADSRLQIGAQNMCDASEGAYTGEIAGRMLKEAGASFVLLGHSERRKIFGETDALIRKKLERALKDQLLPIVCVGETLQEKEADKSEEVLQSQLNALFEGLEWTGGEVIVAYEPVWAIGTGKTATVEVIEAMHVFIEKTTQQLLSVKPRVLYGGSVKPENADSILKLSNVGGLLIGGASLDLESFVAIAENGESFGSL